MAYSIIPSLKRDVVRSLVWDVPAARPVLAPLQREGSLSDDECTRIASLQFTVGESLVSGAPLPDVLGVGPFLVSQRVADLLVSLQPQDQTLIPAILRSKTTGQSISGYYVLHVKYRVACIDYEKTTFHHGTGMEAARKSGFEPRLGAHYVLNAGKLDSHDVWLAESPADRAYFASDRLARKLEEARVRGWDLMPCDIFD